MIPRVVAGEYVRDYVLRLEFLDGSEGEIDFGAELVGPIFEPLRDIHFFRQVAVHPEFRTLV